MSEIPAEAVQAAAEAMKAELMKCPPPAPFGPPVFGPSLEKIAEIGLHAAAPLIAEQARAEERVAVIEHIRGYFAAVDDDLYDDAQTLCGRIERGNHLPAREAFPTGADQ